MNHNYVFEFKRLVFKPLVEDEIEKMRILRNCNKSCFVFAQEITSMEQAAWFRKYMRDSTDIIFSIFDLTGIWLGVASIYAIDLRKKCCEFGRLMLDKTYTREKGLGVDAVEGIFYFATDKLGLEKVMLEVFSDNLAALKTYERAGFVKTGKVETLHDGRELIYMERTIEEEREECQFKC